MDSKNVILAIVFSSLVLIIWAVFFEPPPPKTITNESKVEKIQEENNLSYPSIETSEEKKVILRSDTLKTSKRIFFENENISGSISLTGGIIDDVILKKRCIFCHK